MLPPSTEIVPAMCSACYCHDLVRIWVGDPKPPNDSFCRWCGGRLCFCPACTTTALSILMRQGPVMPCEGVRDVR